MSSYAFLAFNCDGFDGSPIGPWNDRLVHGHHYYLISDYSVNCWTDSDGHVTFTAEYLTIRRLAYIAIVPYRLHTVRPCTAFTVVSPHHRLFTGFTGVTGLACGLLQLQPLTGPRSLLGRLYEPCGGLCIRT